MIALASPASLKGVLTPREASAALAAGMRKVAGIEVDEAPVADGGEGTGLVLEQALGGVWHEAVVADPLGRPVTAAWLVLPDGTRRRRDRGGGGSAAPGAERARPVERIEPWSGRARAGRPRAGARRPCSSASAARRRWTEVPASARSSGTRSGICRSGCSATFATRCSASVAPRGCSARRKGPTPPMWRSSRGGWRRSRSSSRYRELAGRRRRRWTRSRVRGARRRARARCRAGARPDRLRRVALRRPRSSSPARGRSTRRRSKARRPGRCNGVARELGVRCELFGGIVRDGDRRARTVGRTRAAARQDLERLGEELARALA